MGHTSVRAVQRLAVHLDPRHAAEYRGDNGSQTYKAHYDYDRFGNRFQYQNNVNLSYTPVQPTDINPATNRFISTGSTPVVYDNGNPGAGKSRRVWQRDQLPVD